MEKNYMFNMPLERFRYLTGRSLLLSTEISEKRSRLHHNYGLFRNALSWLIIT
ncbi:hypothetical protein [Chryseobacterium defluvii]|uniref:hypothetical protein n=1 Tax=Chryseobacterium defluvii TaxID=160396 RepID=UPI0029394056|nr:hypothetical protein [Chryseobacterium defluvii]